jgi:hypothetical protein
MTKQTVIKSNDLLEISLKEIKKIKLIELKKLIKEQRLFALEKKITKKKIIEKIIEYRKQYEDSESEEEEIKEEIKEIKIDKDQDKNYIYFTNNILQEICLILKDLVDECKIKFTKEGFEIKMIDKSLICLLDISIKNCYERSNFLKEEINIILNISEFIKILECKEPDQNIKIIFTPEKMLIHFQRTEKKSDKFKLSLLDENLIDDIPELNILYNDKFILKSKEFSKLCNKIKKFDTKIVIKTISENNITIGSLNEVIELNITPTSIEIGNKELNVILLLKYINIFCRSDKFTNELKINVIDNNNPIMLEYIVMNYKDSYVKFVISPQNPE